MTTENVSLSKRRASTNPIAAFWIDKFRKQREYYIREYAKGYSPFVTRSMARSMALTSARLMRDMEARQ